MQLIESSNLIPLVPLGCAFATRKDRSCSLRQNWVWTLHSDVCFESVLKIGRGPDHLQHFSPAEGALPNVTMGAFISQCFKLLGLLSESNVYLNGSKKFKINHIKWLDKNNKGTKKKTHHIFIYFIFNFKGMEMFCESIYHFSSPALRIFCMLTIILGMVLIPNS